MSRKIDSYSGRMPGILEEAMIALALRQPIYVLGGFGGAAQLAGELLGLATTATAMGEPSAPSICCSKIAARTKLVHFRSA
jgi:hypothetical protein